MRITRGWSLHGQDVCPARSLAWIVGIVALSWAMGSLPAYAEPVETSERAVADVMSLRASAGSDLVFDEFRVEVLGDGGRRVVVEKHQTGKLAHSAYFFVGDPRTGTYRTRRLPASTAGITSVIRSELKKYPETRGQDEIPHEWARHVMELLGRPAPTTDDVEASGETWEPPPLCDEIEECDSLCSGSWTAKVTTYDPVYVELTSTTAHGWWSWIQTRVCNWKSGGFNQCWAANPSSLGTHWYIQSCTANGPYGGEGFFDLTAFGNYINWDFGLNSYSTRVSQWARVQLKTFTGVVATWGHNDSGEGSWLIFGSFTQSGQNTCF